MSARPSANALYHACQDLIAAGQPVFPCIAAGEKAKAPFTPNGFKDATTDLDVVKRWWKQRGTAAIGIPTGIIYDVLDVDIKTMPDGTVQDGRKHLTRLNHLGLLNGCQKVVRTPSGGWHLYFPASPTMTNKARGATLGLDVRAAGGYVLAPPSYIETTEYAGAYVDIGPTEGSDNSPLYWNLIANELAPLNTETNEAIRLLPSERHASVAALREFVSSLLPGERNNGFFWAVNRCVENGIDPNEMVEPAMLIGLAEDEVTKSIDSALKRAGVRVEQLDSEVDALFPDM